MTGYSSATKNLKRLEEIDKVQQVDKPFTHAAKLPLEEKRPAMLSAKVGEVFPCVDKSGTWDVYLGNGEGYSTTSQDNATIIGMLAKLQTLLSPKDARETATQEEDIDKNRLTDSEIKKLCEEKGCYCPPINEIRAKIAETPIYMREILEATGRKKTLNSI